MFIGLPRFVIRPHAKSVRSARYDLPFRLALKSGAVDSNTCLIGTAHGYFHEEWQDQLAINELRCLHTVHQILCYVLFLGVAHLHLEHCCIAVTRENRVINHKSDPLNSLDISRMSGKGQHDPTGDVW